MGCSEANFYPYWQAIGGDRYIGIDVSKPDIRVAATRYPEGQFVNGEFLTSTIGDSVDFVFLSGVAWSRVENYSPNEYLLLLLGKAASIANAGIAFNYSVGADSKRIPSYKSADVSKICRLAAPQWKSTKRSLGFRTNIETAYLFKPTRSRIFTLPAF